ncbi:MAG: tetratricopeptide repeat protein [Bacteroidetes bacterium]|nr:tetratricopeptide repeat protein [Bacteroidota bacterium]
MKKAFVFLLSVVHGLSSVAQLNQLSTAAEKKETRNGNNQFDKGIYTDAEASYKKALDKKNNMPEATFNLGDAVYEQKRYDEAAKQFQLSAQTNTDKTIKAKAYHNLGNTFLEQQKWEDAAKAYKDALKNNSKDADTKYNLAYANAMLIQQKNQDKQNKDNKDKKDDKKDKKDDKQDKNKDDKNKDQNKDQQSKNQDKKDHQQKGQQPKLSKEEAEKMLQALQGEEQKTNQKMHQKQMKVVNVKIEKDW